MINDEAAFVHALRPLMKTCDFQAIDDNFGTPFYLYFESFIENRVKEVKAWLGDELSLYYAVKANPNETILKSIAPVADGLDISSGGELERAKAAGFSPSRMSFAGPGKTDEELESAVSSGVGSISAESVNELRRIDAVASHLGKKANVTVRINPVKIFKEFAIKMGGRTSQFGIDEECVTNFFDTLNTCSNCQFTGIHIYSGTQCLNGDVLIDNFDNTLSVVEEVMSRTGRIPEVINFGGGFGVPYYEDQVPFDGRNVCSGMSRRFLAFKKRHNQQSITGVIELGRYLMAEAGIYAAKIVDVKISRGKKYCVLDGGMNHHLPASGNFGQVFRKNYRMLNLSKIKTKEILEAVTVVGPLCTSIDVLGANVSIARPAIGDIIGILDSGAYAFTASPHLFLSHRPPVELMVEASGRIRKI